MLSALIAVLLVGIVTTSVPASALRRAGERYLTPLVETVGMDQNWEVFAPDPRRTVIDVHALVDLSDGTRVRWDVPAGGPVVGTYRTYHWHKWMEHVRADANAAVLWEPTARWLARRHSDGARQATRVALVRRWYDTPAPGQGPQRPAWNEHEFYVLELDPEDG